MLIEKPIAEGDVVSIKLVNGDELITRYEGETSDEVKVNRPLALTMSSQGLGMVPWVLLGSKDALSLKKIHILAMVPSKKDAADQYLEGTTSIALR